METVAAFGSLKDFGVDWTVTAGLKKGIISVTCLRIGSLGIMFLAAIMKLNPR